ncbi:GNAT family N-acetyltransferase [Clostridium sp. YIM B02506]|uniref:GNAT family N-acetyltransferase n=1 Tax=Clostridium sp. YIM B02506 TaxID=2910680 RepID=UPI001EEEFA1F|nr:GNAT family N-acetyltransferase [Clostridium sp. YIM B02506]
MTNYIEKISDNNLSDFFSLFSNDKCENCQCTFYFSADNIDKWMNMNVEEAKELRRNITSKCSDGYIYYIDNKPAAWCQCLSPKDSPYLKKLIDIKSDKDTRVISCFFIKKEYRGKGIIKDLLKKVIIQCKKEGVKLIYGIPVYDGFLKSIDENLINEKLHTGYKKLFDQFKFHRIGNNSRYYFMELNLDKSIDIN